MAGFAPLLELSHESVQRLEYEFTTMPGRSVIISGLIWSAIYIVLSYVAFDAVYGVMGLGPFLSVIGLIEGLISFGVGGVIYYPSISSSSYSWRSGAGSANSA